jgi:hypothetical protein
MIVLDLLLNFCRGYLIGVADGVDKVTENLWMQGGIINKRGSTQIIVPELET